MSELTREDLSQFCGNLQYRLKLLGQTRLHTDRLLATRFNVFEYIQPGENALSDIIADLLRPNGKHGQGDAFLKEFVKAVDSNVPATWHSCAVHREHSTATIENRQRRIDILIELDSFTIAIENKPWAGEQHEQLHDYTSHLNRRFIGKYVIIYLSPDGAEPTSLAAGIREQMLREKKLLLWAYSGAFREWLTQCYHVCAADKMRWFLSDLLAFTEQQFPAQDLALNP